MKEVFIINAEEEEGVLEQLKDTNDKIDSAIVEFNESGGDKADAVRQAIVVFSLFNEVYNRRENIEKPQNLP